MPVSVSLSGVITPAAVESPAVGALLRLSLACFLGVPLEVVLVTGAASAAAQLTVPADAPVNTQVAGTCASLGRRRLAASERLRAGTPGLLRALDASSAGAAATTNVSLSVHVLACSAAADGSAALSPAVLARLSALAGGGGSQSTGPALGSFITAAAGASGVSAAGVTTALSAGTPAAASPSPAPGRSGAAAAAGSGSSSSSGPSPVILGAAGGGGLLLCCALAVCVVCCVIRKRKQRRAEARAGAGLTQHDPQPAKTSAFAGSNPMAPREGAPGGTGPPPVSTGASTPQQRPPRSGSEAPGAFSHSSPLHRVKRTFHQAKPADAADDGASDAGGGGSPAMRNSPLLVLGSLRSLRPSLLDLEAAAHAAGSDADASPRSLRSSERVLAGDARAGGGAQGSPQLSARRLAATRHGGQSPLHRSAGGAQAADAARGVALDAALGAANPMGRAPPSQQSQTTKVLLPRGPQQKYARASDASAAPGPAAAASLDAALAAPNPMKHQSANAAATGAAPAAAASLDSALAAPNPMKSTTPAAGRPSAAAGAGGGGSGDARVQQQQQLGMFGNRAALAKPGRGGGGVARH